MVQHSTSEDQHKDHRRPHRHVQLAWVPSLDMVFILRPFGSAELRRPLSDKLLAELAWEDEMAEKTKRLYGM